MRIAVDAQLCSGQGRCYTVSSDLFTSDEEGFVEQRGTEFDMRGSATSSTTGVSSRTSTSSSCESSLRANRWARGG